MKTQTKRKHAANHNHKQKQKHKQKGNTLQITKYIKYKSTYKEKIQQIDDPKKEVLQNTRGSDELNLQKQQQTCCK